MKDRLYLLITLFFNCIVFPFELSAEYVITQEEPLSFLAAKTLYPEVDDEQLIVWDNQDHFFQIIIFENGKYGIYTASIGQEIIAEWALQGSNEEINENIKARLFDVPSSLTQKLTSPNTVKAAFGDENSCLALIGQLIENSPQPIEDIVLSRWDLQHLIADQSINNKPFLCSLELLYLMDHLNVRVIHFRSVEKSFHINVGFSEWPDTIASFYFMPGSGFTYSPSTGTVPSDGYIVSLPNYTYMIPATRFFAGSPDQEFAHRIIKEYIRKNSPMLASSNIYIGGWHDTTSDLFFLDLSEIFYDLDKAIQAGIDRDQIAIFDLSTGTVIPTGGTGGVPQEPANF